MNCSEFFYDDTFEDYIPVIDLKMTTVEVTAEVQHINIDWTTEAVEDLTRTIDMDIIRRLMELRE